MPWLETAPMTQRRDFLADHRCGPPQRALQDEPVEYGL
jgi:hypothetical protein